MFSEYEIQLMNTKPRFLTEEEKKIRKKCKNKKYRKIYYQEHKEEEKENNKEYREEHKEEKKEYNKKYAKTPEGYKITKKGDWKRLGLNMTDFEEIFKRYCETTNCDNCNCILTKDKRNTSTTKCMDHCHITGTFRNILCIACNVRRK